MGKGMMGGGQQPASGPVYSHDQQAVNQEQQLRNQQFYQAQLEANRARAAQQGRQLGQEFFGHGTMPRLREGRSQEQADLIAARRAQADYAGQRSGQMQDTLNRQYEGLGGYTSPEYQALHSQAMEGFQNQAATSQRELQRAQANNRVSGAAAAAQIARLRQGTNAAAAQAERDLMIKNIDEQQRRLGAYQGALSGAEGTEWQRQQQAQSGLEGITSATQADELQRQQYNNNAYNRETAGQLQAILGQQGISGGDWASAAQSAIAQQQMNQATSPNGGGKK